MAKKQPKTKKKLKESTLTPKKTLTQQALVPKKTLAQESEGEESEHESEGETENENENENEHESEDAEDADGSGSDGDHDDADADVELIKKMINEYLGDGSKGLEPHESEALHSLAKQAMHAHKEMGHKEEEAYQKAGDAIALAHHLGQKQKAKQAESEDEDAPAPPKKGTKPAPKKSAPSGDADASDDGEESEHESEHENEKKESNRKPKDKLLEAEGRIAALEAELKTVKVDGYVDKKLKESKLQSSITKKFREAAGPFKSHKDFDDKFKIFQEGVSNATRDVDWGLMMEKASTSEDGGRDGSTKGLDFSGCVE